MRWLFPLCDIIEYILDSVCHHANYYGLCRRYGSVNLNLMCWFRLPDSWRVTRLTATLGAWHVIKKYGLDLCFLVLFTVSLTISKTYVLVYLVFFFFLACCFSFSKHLVFQTNWFFSQKSGLINALHIKILLFTMIFIPAIFLLRRKLLVVNLVLSFY